VENIALVSALGTPLDGEGIARIIIVGKSLYYYPLVDTISSCSNNRGVRLDGKMQLIVHKVLQRVL
jgi:hypothetical protein